MTINLSQWLRYMQMHPWHSMQLATIGPNSIIPVTSSCNGLIYEYAWQSVDQAGREDIRRAITYAEKQWNEQAHYPARPTFKTVTLEWPKMGNKTLVNYSPIDMTGHWMNIKLPDGHVSKVGYEHITTPQACAITYSDLDGDGLFETATVTATVPAGTTEDELYITFQSADFIYPYTPPIPARSASIVGTTATITIDTYNLVRPIVYTMPNSRPLNPTVLPPSVDSPFATTIDVARRFCDDSGTTIDTAQAVLIWESLPAPLWATVISAGNYPDPSAKAYAIARMGIRDGVAGIVYGGEAVYDSTSGEWSGRANFSNCKPPDRIMIRYLAGRESSHIDMAIAQLSAANLSRPICACQPANKELYHWQTDLARVGGTNELYSVPSDIVNPFGSRRGQVYAWRTIQDSRVLQGIIGG